MNDVNGGVDERFKKYIGHFILQEEALRKHKRSVADDFPDFRKTQEEEEEDYMRVNIIKNFKLPIL
ncbi:hypothetical protein BTO04_05040 [Polaribacter sp. SA4-10]|uniref:hypothetical protein n=1 Tax=Polaribacter sp. SA4-10 TaxID=754397 RepID=UPI000B3CF4C7|nr:hypothetical protein [Polaribacter sp. SA4-10]ARV06106.1 hypothetical protein BTO04_05040 [Polaribacter sp. SA4-10]